MICGRLRNELISTKWCIDAVSAKQHVSRYILARVRVEGLVSVLGLFLQLPAFATNCLPSLRIFSLWVFSKKPGDWQVSGWDTTQSRISCVRAAGTMFLVYYRWQPYIKPWKEISETKAQCLPIFVDSGWSNFEQFSWWAAVFVLSRSHSFIPIRTTWGFGAKM